ncbi:MAG: hypothetical protein ACK56I_05040, partial [bacterium]
EAVHRFHDHLGHQHIGSAPGAGRFERVAAGRSGAHLEPVKQSAPGVEDMLLVVDQQDCHGASPAGRDASAAGNSLKGGGNNSCRSTGSARVSCNWPRW